jgi:DNA-binding transcriptional MerR regulator
LEYSIGEFSKRTQLSIHTLRYYEQEQLIKPRRHSNNRRYYAETDVLWIDFIKRLKATGMPVKIIARYAGLRAEGDDTLLERKEMLIQHRQHLSNQIMELQEHMSKINDKISIYCQKIEKMNTISETHT